MTSITGMVVAGAVVAVAVVATAGWSVVGCAAPGPSALEGGVAGTDDKLAPAAAAGLAGDGSAAELGVWAVALSAKRHRLKGGSHARVISLVVGFITLPDLIEPDAAKRLAKLRAVRATV